MNTEKGWAPLWERITPDHLAHALKDIEEGIPKVTAFVALGYSRSAFHRAQNAGRDAEAKDDAGEPLTKREAGALAFWRKLETAFAKAEITILKSIAKAGQGEIRRLTAPDGKTVERIPRQWQAERWRLECTRPEYRVPMQVVPDPAPSPTGPAPGTPEYEQALVSALAARPDLLARALEAAKPK